MNGQDSQLQEKPEEERQEEKLEETQQEKEEDKKDTELEIQLTMNGEITHFDSVEKLFDFLRRHWKKCGYCSIRKVYKNTAVSSSNESERGHKTNENQS